MCLEVVEHLKYVENVIKELERVGSKYILVSVPREPIWRILNMIRGKYWINFGNTPGHLNHWNSASFISMLKKYFKILKVFKPLPWTVVLMEIK